MRTIKLILIALILIAIVVLSVANREMVTLKLLPDGLSGVLDLSIQLPLFVVGLLFLVLGMVIGYFFEWMREHKHRRRAKANAREAERLRSERDRLRRQTGRADDDVLAILN